MTSAGSLRLVAGTLATAVAACTVVEGPGGALYVLTSNRDGRGDPLPGDDRIVRVTPPGS